MIEKKIFLVLLISTVFLNSCSKKITTEQKEDYVQVSNRDGSTLGYHPESGVKLLTVDGYAFKDLNKNGKLDSYEDWRLSTDLRANDLATKLTLVDIGGLMLYSSH